MKVQDMYASETPSVTAASVKPSDLFPKVLSPPRHTLGQWPTPLEAYEHSQFGKFLVKRDDLAGFGGDARSGVKARKLEALLDHMDQHQLGSMYMPLGNITNLGPELLRLAEELEISVQLRIVDNPRLPQHVREQIYTKYANNVTLRGSSYTAAALALASQVIKNRLFGRKALVVAPSPAHPKAIMGTARGYLEAMSQCLEQFGRLPSRLYVASAAGCTVSGFGIAEAMMREAGYPPVEIVAAQVVSDPLSVVIPILTVWTLRSHKLKLKHRPRIIVRAPKRNRTYGGFDQDHIALCERVETDYGLTIDPIYGGKSFTVMEADENDQPTDGLALFWHCGYTPTWKLFETT